MIFTTRITICVCALTTLTTFATAATPWADLPWADLEAELIGGAASLVDATPVDYTAQCLPGFIAPEGELFATNHDLIDQPSGLCMNHFFCGFQRCNPFRIQSPEMSLLEKWQQFATSAQQDPNNSSLLDAANPSYDLPSKVLFPRAAKDVYAAVKFAGQHGIEISIKNSGHSYTGASTKKDTLHLNMNQFQRYTLEPPVDCDDGPQVQEQQDIAADLSNQPCALAAARNMAAVIRVGGGENFDKYYRAVKGHNEAQPDGIYKYHVCGGAAGTVSPMGWTWQGGLSGTTGGRIYGFGVDQVLQVEMVLPLLFHVRFGPTSWEAVEGYQYPRTTKVTGECNENPDAPDEADWVWSECPADANIDFDELWFAVNGGGGGTFGVVTSVYLQLHDYPSPMSSFNFGNGALTASPCNLSIEESGGPLANATWSFLIDFLLNPSVLGVPENVSRSCGAPALPQFLAPFQVAVYCYGEGNAEAMLSSWASYLADRKETMVESGVAPESVEKATTCFKDMVKTSLDYAETILISDGPHAGKARDLPPPGLESTTELEANVILPKTFVLDNKDMIIEWMLSGKYYGYWAFGGNTATAQDQSNSLSDAHRTGGVMVSFPLAELDEDFYQNILPQAYDTTDGDNFPGFIGSNHAGPNTRGPLKSDWSKPCSFDWTEEERDEKCIPLQEAIWGTKTLTRLEAVKDAIDPNRMLDCYGCIGNNRPKDSAVGDTTDDPPADTTDDPPADTTDDPPADTTDDPPADTTDDPPADTTDDPPADTTDDPQDGSSAFFRAAAPSAAVVVIGSLSILHQCFFF